MGPETFDVVVVGGGCIGTSTAFHLAELGCPDVLVMEAGSLGSGSTGRAAGGIRLQHGDALNVRLAQRSLAEFSRFEAMTGVAIGFRQVGYLFLLDSKADLESFRQSAKLQRALGIPTELLTPGSAAQLVPQLVTKDLVGATYCPLDGYAMPESVVQGYALAARRRGVTIRQGCRAVRILTRSGRVHAVETETSTVSCGSVVISAGVGSAALAATAGVTVPVTGQVRRIFYSSNNGGLADGIPLTVDFSSGFYFRREGPGIVFAGREGDLELLSGPATHRLPVIADVPITSSWYGDYDMSPDCNALVGESDAIAGLYYATGFSGHGFQLSPAVGEHLAEIALSRRPWIDLAPFSAERLGRKGSERAEPIVI